MVVKNSYGFYTLKDKPTQKELEEYYRDKYYQDAAGGYERNYSCEEVEYFNNKIAERYHIVENALKGNDTPTLLDIGCGEGWVLNFFLEKKWSVTGLDYSDFGCGKFNSHCIPYLINGDVYTNINNLTQQGSSFDVAWLDNVLEHVLDPEELIRKINTIVRPNGLLVIEVPNDFSFLQDYLLRNGYIDREFWIAIPDHISYFNREGLQNLLTTFGWTTITILADYPIDWNLLNKNTNYIMDKTVGKSCHLERVVFENMIHQLPIDEVIRFYEAMARVGLGRQIVGIFRKGAK